MKRDLCITDFDARHDCAWHSTCRDMNHTCNPYHKCLETESESESVATSNES